MNSNGDYTICNLDNHTYTSNYGQPQSESMPTSTAYGGYPTNVNNGLADGGAQLGYGASAGVSSGPGDHLGPHHPQGHHQQGGGHHMGGYHSHHHQGQSVISPASPTHHGYGPLQHHPHHGHPHNPCLPPPGQPPPHYEYYGGSVITNGSPGGGVDGLNAGLYSPYGPPEPAPGQPPHCGGIPVTSAPHGYDVHDSALHGLSPSADHPPVTTYKWMTVKRTIAKPGEFL